MAPRTKRSVLNVQSSRIHAFLIVFWILVAHIAAIAQFTRGFLLTRPVLPYQSNTTSVTAKAPFNRAVVLVVDALRYDFIQTPEEAEAKTFLGHFPVTDITSNSANGFTLKFMADPPTTTLQRLKGLTTGSLPAFVDAGSNFAGFKIEEDNWVYQANTHLGPVSFVGDDTWEALFSHLLSENYPYPSLNVRDLDTVDNGVKEHLPRMIQNTTNKVIIGHMLGVDHVGHRYGPSHPSMAAKLDETFTFVKEVAQLLDENTVLFVMGDHGMDPTGNHGGDSKEELESALWVYSKRDVFSPLGDTTVNQIDLVPTISGLLGLPIPFNSLGFPIRQAFGNQKLWDQVSEATVNQIKQYSDMVGMPRGKAEEHAATAGSTEYGNKVFQAHMLHAFKEAWIEFDTRAMLGGIALLVASTAMSLIIYNASRAVTLAPISYYQGIGGGLGIVCGLITSIGQFSEKKGGIDTAINVAFYAGSGTVLTGLLAAFNLMRFSWPSNWSYFALLILILELCTSFSNSYVIWESHITHYFLVSIFIIMGISCVYQGSPLVMYLGGWCTAVTIFVLRLSSSWHVCREETSARCVTTFFEIGSSMVPLWTYFAIGVLGLTFPYFLKRFWNIGQNNVGVASLLLNMTSLALMLCITYWSLDNAEARGWLASDMTGLQPIKLLLGRLSMAVGLLGILVWWRSSPPVEFSFSERGIPQKIIGFNNIHGADVLLTVLCLFWTIAVTNKAPAILALSGLLYICLCTLDFADVTMTKYTLLVPVIFDLLGHSFFYFTGHQATIPSIQWDAAFIAASTVSYPWSPLTVFLNTMGSVLVSSTICSFSSLWRRPVFKDSRMPVAFVVRAIAGLVAVTSARTIASMAASFMLRRHLMTWKIFAPRFMFGGIALLTTDVACLLAVVLSGHTIKKVTELFG